MPRVNPKKKTQVVSGGSAIVPDAKIGFGPWFFFQWFLPLIQLVIGIVIVLSLSHPEDPNDPIPAAHRTIVSMFDDVVLGVFAVALLGSAVGGCWHVKHLSSTDSYRMALLTLIAVSIFATVLVTMSLLIPAHRIRPQVYIYAQLLLLVPSTIFSWRIRT
jgi:hypothetical protein